MGLFSIEKCVICNNEVGALKRIKLKSKAYLCNNCIKKTGLMNDIDRLMNLSVEGIKKRIRFHLADMKNNLKRVQNFNVTHKIENYIWFDDNHKWFVVLTEQFSKKIDKNSYVFKYDEIIDVDVLEDGTSITKGGLGEAIIGGALFGLAGTIVGATCKETKKICNQLKIKITTRNHDRQVVYIDLISTEIEKDSALYKSILKVEQNILSKFKIIIDQIEQEKVNSTASNNDNLSPADEIKKYKELLDLGAISKKEFMDKKKQLLNL